MLGFREKQWFLRLLVCLFVTWSLSSETWAQERSYPISIAVGSYSPCALFSNGSVICWDVVLTNEEVGISAKPVEGLPLLRSFDIGEGFSCGLTLEGKVTCWSDVFEDVGDYYAPAEVFPSDRFEGLPVLSSLSTGYGHVCGIDLEGELWCFGSNARGERAIEPGAEPGFFQANHVDGLPKVLTVGAGVNNSCAVTNIGKVFCWGTDDNQMPGRRFIFESVEPIEIPFLDGISKIENGRNFVCALQRPNIVFCFGSNIMGQLAATRDQIEFGGVMRRIYTRDIIDLSVSYFAACALPDTGVVWCWGAWDDQEMFEPRPKRGLPPAEAVSVGEDIGCIISTDKEIWCWGKTYREGSDGIEIEFTYDPYQIVY